MNQSKYRRGKRGGCFRGDRFRARGDESGGNSDESFDQNQSSSQHQHKVTREMPSKRLSEEEIGVTEYVNEHEGFNAIIKSRYSDFQVSEINLNGEIAKLTELDPPQLPNDKAIDEDEDLVLNKYNLEILPMETWDNINKLAVAKNPCTDKVEIDVTGMSKEQRTQIHDAVKKAFGKGIIGSTVTVGDKKFVTCEKFRKGVRVDKRVKWSWPGEYTYFLLYKENCDTMEAAARLAERLKINLRPSIIGYAGTKDKRAKTTQWFSARKVEPVRIAAAVRDLRDVRAGNYSFADRGLRLGMLRGNRFRIVLRNVTVPDATVSDACSLLRRNGFINYYGLQRFGVRRDTPTHAIGLRLCRGEYEEAIKMILEQRDGPLSAILRTYHAEGAAAAWRAHGRRDPRGAEMRVLRALAADPRDFVRAIDAIPRNARLLYIHSYQSLVWNKVASQRVRRHGLRVVAGDLVALNPAEVLRQDVFDENDAYSDTDENDDTENEKDDNMETDDHMETDAEPSAASNQRTKKDKQGTVKEERKAIAVKVLAQVDVDTKRYNLCDVMLPLPGYSIRYPPNMQDYYEELLAKDGMKLDMKSKNRRFSLCGAYRMLAARPLMMRWRCLRYSQPHADLQLSDLDELSGRTLGPEGGPYKALIAEFILATSCYATMALRELLKMDTASDNQALQNNYYKVKASQQEGEAEQPGDAEGSGEASGMAAEAVDKRKLESDEEGDAKKVKPSV